jgi:hypothetical protein
MSLDPSPVIERSALSAYIPAYQIAACCADYVVTQPGRDYACHRHYIQLAIDLCDVTQNMMSIASQNSKHPTTIVVLPPFFPAKRGD